VNTDRFRHTVTNPAIVQDFPVDVLRAMGSDRQAAIQTSIPTCPGANPTTSSYNATSSLVRYEVKKIIIL
jgi:hypothetical protein